MQIFLSYAAEDKDIAEPIAFSLRARGHKVFFDRDDLPPGGEYDMRIEKAVERSTLFIFLLSPASVAKGRFTLTELEFARHKWRKADGHVLPVMIKPTRFEEIPNFLKSVTVLEPKGNVAAEVAAAVEPLAQSAVGGQMFVYGGLGVVSGFLTTPLNNALGAYLSLELAGLAFGLALVAGFAYYFRFHARQLLIIPFVLAGWFLAQQTLIWRSHGGEQTFLEVLNELTVRCEISKEQSSECEAWRAKVQEWRRAEEKNAIWAWLTAGAIGAGLTATGVPIATRQIFSFASFLSTTLAGAAIAGVGYAIGLLADWNGVESFDARFAMFVTWQAVVAAVIGRSIR